MFKALRESFGRLSFRWKAIAFIASIEGLFNVMFAVIVVSVMQSNLEAQFYKRAQSTAQVYATTATNAVLATDIASLESFVEEVMANKDLRYVRIRDTAYVLAEKEQEAGLLAHAFRPDTDLQQVDDDIFDTYAVISEGGTTYGRIELGLSTDLLGSTISQIQLKFILIGVGEILLSAIASFILGSFLVKRLMHLEEGALQIANGRFGAQVPVEGQDEISKTSIAFNRMSKMTADLIDTQRQALNELNFQKFALDQHAIVSIADVDGNIIYANDKLCELSQYSLDELIGQNHRILKSDEQSSAVYQQMWGNLVSGLVWHGQLKNKSKDGSFYWVESTIVPFLDEQNKPFQYVGISTNITTQKNIGEELIHAKEVAEQASLAKSEFLATMSHEIRTPMNGVIGMTDLLLDTNLSEKQAHYAETIRKSGEVLMAIINDILDFSKIDAGKLVLEMVEFDLREMVMDTLQTFVPAAESKSLSIKSVFPADVSGQFRGDSGRIRQILVNLIGNAVKFTHKGEISVNLSLGKMGGARNWLRFEVRDTGIGIPQAAQNYLFTSFTQVDASTTREYGGTGLGLAICKRLVEAMGGEIGLDSEVGVGSTFWFVVPLETVEPSGSSPELEKQSPEVEVPPLRVLVVEDNFVNQEVAKAILEKMGHEVDVADNGAEAVEAVEAFPYDLVFMDMQMPEMDGLEATRNIRDLKNDRSSVLIVAMTANAQTSDRQNCLDAGMNGYLTKPINPGKISETLEDVFAQYGR